MEFQVKLSRKMANMLLVQGAEIEVNGKYYKVKGTLKETEKFFKHQPISMADENGVYMEISKD